MAIWLKVTLLLIYLSILFLLARLLESVAWYEQGQISRRLLDPMALSVLKLKAMLEQRGVSYDNIVEKGELKQLVQASGSVTEEEIETSSTVTDDITPITNYTGHLDFYEQVEDAKDSMWLVEVVSDTGPLLTDTSWLTLQKKVHKFGVRFGRFDCQLNVRMCVRKQWLSSRLVLALPENPDRIKANVALYSYTGPIRVNSIFDWIKTKVNAQVKTIQDVDELQHNWMTAHTFLSPDVQIVFISSLSCVPLFLSALGVKFPGRVKIGYLQTDSDSSEKVSKRIGIKNLPSYIVLTAEGQYVYGRKSGELLSFRSMEMFLKSLYPSLNDLFIVSVICTNIASCFEVCLANGTIFKRLIKLASCIFKFNVILLLVWILLLAILQIPIFEVFSFIGLKILRMCTLTTFSAYIRKDMLYFTSNLVLPISVLSIMVMVTWYVRSRYFSTEIDEESDWWNFSNLQTLDYEQWWELTRLRPFDQIFNPTVGVLSVGADALDIPDTYVSKQYIKHLPTWFYKNPANLYTATGDNADNNSEIRTDKLTQGDKNQISKKGTKRGKGISTNSNTRHMNNPSDSDIESSTYACRLMDSNYKCECRQACICSQRYRNPQNLNENPNSDFPNADVPNVGAEDATLDCEPDILDPFQEFANSYKTESLNQQLCQPASFLESSQCVICLDNYCQFEMLRGLPCHHVFHDKCILAWLMRENHFCPVCRWPSYKPKSGDTLNNLHDE